VPRRVQELRNRVRVARRELTQLPGAPEPGVADLAAHTGLTEEEVTAGLEALDSYSTLSLDAELATGDDGHSLAETLGQPDGSYDVVIDREAAKEGLRRLPERERAILYMRFFEDMTQSRIADQLGISQMHVSRLITRSCARVRAEALGRPA
ncbi:sigma-70 family RNA polymerase sigma factor, partial [Streptomyces sp. NPDC004237]|uniref:sigma-70 family RNA polymerase sigma factor n=1 Tax=Streptomyces sp. NPDC004237 TaxID=3154455 RepID=UPI0033AEF6F1